VFAAAMRLIARIGFHGPARKRPKVLGIGVHLGRGLGLLVSPSFLSHSLFSCLCSAVPCLPSILDFFCGVDMLTWAVQLVCAASRKPHCVPLSSLCKKDDMQRRDREGRKREGAPLASGYKFTLDARHATWLDRPSQSTHPPSPPLAEPGWVHCSGRRNGHTVAAVFLLKRRMGISRPVKSARLDLMRLTACLHQASRESCRLDFTLPSVCATCQLSHVNSCLGRERLGPGLLPHLRSRAADWPNCRVCLSAIFFLRDSPSLSPDPPD
jgi:hypothetical protein